jgi:dUTP pyrophosphatase
VTRKYRHTDARQAVTEPPRGVPFMRLERRRDETAAAARERAKAVVAAGDQRTAVRQRPVLDVPDGETEGGNVKVKIRNESPYELRYATDGASGLDLCANETETVRPHSRKLFATGIHLALPQGYEAHVRGRSGLAIKYGIIVAQGTIDEDYRGPVGVILINTSDTAYLVREGDRIAQLVVCPVTRITPVLVDSVADLGETVRGAGGFGSTGVR